MLDFSSLESAIKSLEKAIVRSKLDLNDEEIRDAVIQRFEYTYELSWKMLKRQLEQETPSSSSIDALSFKDLIREGAEKQFLSNVNLWFSFREGRNKTSHGYDEKNAKEVYQIALTFLPEAQQLLMKLKARI